MGTQGFGCANNNGKRLSDLCVKNKLVIGGTLFMNREIHKPHGDRQTKGRLAKSTMLL